MIVKKDSIAKSLQKDIRVFVDYIMEVNTLTSAIEEEFEDLFSRLYECGRSSK